MNNQPKVVHLTSVHSRKDIRVFLKQCVSLAKEFDSVSLVVSDGNGDETLSSVNIFDVGSFDNRLARIFCAPRQVYRKAISLDADIYHIHDPELVPIGLKLKRQNKAVIFDAHEDFPKQLLSKPYLNPVLRRLFSESFKFFERLVCRKLDAVVGATPFISEKFARMGARSVNINNYPLLGELSIGGVDWSEKQDLVCYVGGIAEIRGIHQIVEGIGSVKSQARLALAGKFASNELQDVVCRESGWANVDNLGFLGREQVRDLMGRCKAGLVTFLPTPNHTDAQPNKMFEYMSAGLPVIASNFTLWREIIEGNQCGICVDPRDPKAIAEAIDFIVEHPKEAETMGQNGQRAVQEKYNWLIEEQKLLDLYMSLVK